MTDDLDLRRRRAAYRAHHRGTKEMDALVGRFADVALPELSGDDLTLFEGLLAMPDPTLQEWIFSGVGMETTTFSGLIEQIRSFHGLDQIAGAKG